MRLARSRGGIASFVAAVLAVQSSSDAQTVSPDSGNAEIVVTARRIGVPFWTVRGPAATLILIPAEAKAPANDPASLAALTKVMRNADRLIYPGSSEIELSPFKMIGYAIRWKRMSTLPRDMTLASLLGPHDYRRLLALNGRGLIPAKFERTHPFPLSVKIKEKAFGERKSDGSIQSQVNRIAKQYRLERVPPPTLPSKPYAHAFFRTAPAAYVPCLRATLEWVESGDAAAADYARAWQDRRISAVVASPVFRAFELCIPPALKAIDRPDIRSQVRSLMGGGRTTVAVVPLASLAQHGGVLDDLHSHGFSITGPDWK